MNSEELLDTLRRVRVSLFLALAMMLLGAAALFVTRQAYERASAEHRQALERRSATQNQLARAREDEAQIRQTIGRYSDLQARGIIGPEQRLVWVETIRSLRADLRLFDLQYEISPQRRIADGLAPGSSGAYEFLQSSMRLQLDMLHEGDLVRLLDGLRARLPAYVRERECALARSAQAAPTGVGPQLSADCSLDLITIHEAQDRR